MVVIGPINVARPSDGILAGSIAAAVARKPRTPPPPRRVQAPKTRRPERERPSRRAVLLVLAALAGVVMAIGPARRASRLDVLQALAYE
jgi:ABC-type lipoprotein release transport system permease subunit